MKVTKLKNELRQLSLDQLQELLDGFRRELFSLRLNATTSHVKDYALFSKLRHNIARVLTQINQLQSANNV